MTASPVESLIREPYTPITIEAAGIIKLSSDSQGIYIVQSTLPSQLSNDITSTPREQLVGGLIRQKYRDLRYGFESQPGDVARDVHRCGLEGFQRVFGAKLEEAGEVRRVVRVGAGG